MCHTGYVPFELNISLGRSISPNLSFCLILCFPSKSLHLISALRHLETFKCYSIGTLGEPFVFLLAWWCPSLRELVLTSNDIIDDKFAAWLNSGNANHDPYYPWVKWAAEDDSIWNGSEEFRMTPLEKMV